MLSKRPKYRKGVSSNQVKLLELLFKFRFVSVPLLSEYMDKDNSTVYERLLVLVEQGYIQKAYDSTYRLPPKPATYSLAAKGIKYLRNNNQDERYSETALRNMYKNKSASASLVGHSLDLFKLCFKLEKQYPGTFHVFSKSEMTLFDKFVRPLPDIYLRAKTTDEGTSDKTNNTSEPQEYVLETLEPGIMTWILKKQIRSHQELAETFKEESDCKYPTLLFICGNDNTERRIQKIVENSYLDLDIWTTTKARLESHQIEVWRDEWDEDEVILRSL